ncbi:NADH-ubiquinone oxidoreductase-F iron-sulfur binding region domain-containing protein [Aminivibrio sp.]|jgi:NADH-quinone oxidoreductase subunit F|uniref:NADH-ubiquinone oxidoreductase-F iron-sulfur binding region domain-containing protein n=1 Tax=Aminivibrio sp. TaxID=1872489 RepID=UPI001A4D821D|nr:NADH-ubiquinone oxidoreductase-F iron-sulfur binding region domain-containing protein [Aminivibrio sp.]MBL3540348.1 4Fe-4S binding protein [Aminivibrio sp.]
MPKTIVKVGLASCGVAAGAVPIYETLTGILAGRDDVEIKKVGCIGLCYMEPIVEVERDGKSITYGKVDTAMAKEIAESHVNRGEIVLRGVILDPESTACENERMDSQVRIVLRNSGLIDPEKIEEYIARDGYKALEKAFSMSPLQVIDEVLASGLRGRGGAGFPTGLKWKFANGAKGDKKYFVCNADEGDPGAFMDRSVLESDPHSIIEGMAIGAYAIGSDEGIIYCRAEYPLAIKHLNVALDQAREKGFLGKNILGSGFSFDIHIKEGAGAFVCGEETAMIASIEGRRGMPRPRPPFPANSGVFGKPTNINNVETIANIPWILMNGAAKFAEYGIGKSRGTKVFALAGKIKKGGLAEVPMGMPLREVIFKVAGGIAENKKFKAVQLGGPSGGCIPESLLDTPVDYESINATGAIMGSGGMVVMDETTCIVDVAKFFLAFVQKESCGKCPFCRIGTKRMLEILERITEGKGAMEDLDTLLYLAHQVKEGSLCGLGQTAPNPVMTTLKYFREEYEAHIRDKKCPAKVCTGLIHYVVDPAVCIGCTKCARNCPVSCIAGEVKKPHVIDDEKCIRCGQCKKVCPVGAISVE